MWKRDEAVRPASGQPTAAPQPAAPAQAGATSPRSEISHHMEKDIVNIGKSVVIKGELNGSEDLTIEGHVEGTIQLKDNVLTIGPNGRINQVGLNIAGIYPLPQGSGLTNNYTSVVNRRAEFRAYRLTAFGSMARVSP